MIVNEKEPRSNVEEMQEENCGCDVENSASSESTVDADKAGEQDEASDTCACPEDNDECSDCSEEENTNFREKRGDKKKIKKLESEIEGLTKQLEAAKAALAASEDKYLRMIAEYDNYRKRTAKEKEAIYGDVFADVLKELLPVLDNLERAAGYGESESVAKGVELTLKSFKDALNRLGVSEIKTSDVRFDPNLHYAVLHVEDESFGENEIVEVLQKGYIKGDRVLRCAMVKVAN